MVAAGGRIADDTISDYLKTPKSKKIYKVASGGVQGAWERSVEAYKQGDSVFGAAALGALEGMADGASSVVKDSLGPGKKQLYSIYESNEAIDFGAGTALERLLPDSGAVSSHGPPGHEEELGHGTS